MFGLSCHVKKPPRRAALFIYTAGALCELYLLEEVISFIIHKDKRREIFHFDFPDGFHSSSGYSTHFQALNTSLRQYSGRTTDTAKVEAASVYQASVTCWLRLPFASMIILPPCACSLIDIRSIRPAVVRPENRRHNLPAFWPDPRSKSDDLWCVCGSPSPLSIRSFSLA